MIKVLIDTIAWGFAIGGAGLAYLYMISDIHYMPIRTTYDRMYYNFTIIKPMIVSLIGLAWIWWH